MTNRIARRVATRAVLLIALAGKAWIASEAKSTTPHQVEVNSSVAQLVIPILDLKQEDIEECGTPGAASRCTEGPRYNRHIQREIKLNALLQNLIGDISLNATEAKVVLSCFRIGDSHEELDSVISKGKSVIRFLQLYKRHAPHITGHRYSTTIVLSREERIEIMAGAIATIKSGRKSSADSDGS